LTDNEKNSIAEAIAKQLLTGAEVDKNLTEKLIKGLCEEYHEVRQRGLTGASEETVGEV
jgi:hypothetical protein